MVNNTCTNHVVEKKSQSHTCVSDNAFNVSVEKLLGLCDRVILTSPVCNYTENKTI